MASEVTRCKETDMAISFNTTLSAGDWDERLGGWKCEALTIPGATLTAVFFDGRQADPRKYKVSDSAITWAAHSRPAEILAKISLTKDLSEIERERLQLERDKVVLEEQKFASEKKWRWITAAGAVASALLTFAGTSYIRPLIFPAKVNTEKHFVPPAHPTVVDKLPDESGDEFFDLIKDISVFDLRSWKPTPTEAKGSRYSPVNYINYLHVRKKQPAKTYVAHYATGGYAIDLRCITQQANVLQSVSSDHPGQKAYSIEVDIEREPVGSEFLIVVEGTYWNGFANELEESAETYTDRDISKLGELALVVLFPEVKPFSTFELLTKRSDSQEYKPYVDNSRFYADRNNQFIYWSVRGREPNSHYRMKWKW
jgi:hypothetical protein